MPALGDAAQPRARAFARPRPAEAFASNVQCRHVTTAARPCAHCRAASSTDPSLPGARDRFRTIIAKHDDRHPTFLVVVTSFGEVVTREGDTPMLAEFLQEHEAVILSLTEQKTLELAGDHPSSTVLKEGLPRFFRQVIEVIREAGAPAAPPAKDVDAIARAADRGDEQAMATAAGQPREAGLARTAGLRGIEMVRALTRVPPSGRLCANVLESSLR